MIYIITILLGLLFGSFLNVCIYRIPRVHVKLTEQSLANLREISPNNGRQNTQNLGTQACIAQHNTYVDLAKRFICRLLLPVCHFLGLYPDLKKETIPPGILTNLESLTDQDYATVSDFAIALEAQIGREQTARYGDLIFHSASFNKESIVLPSSHCPNCRAPIKPWDNVPVLSFLLLRGKCRTCQAKISLRYPLVELLTAMMFLAFVHQFGITLVTLVYLIFAGVLIAISFIDLDHQIIPDRISLPGLAFGLIVSFLLPLPATSTRWYGAFLGAIVGGGIIVLIRSVGTKIFKKEAMGGGDVKLMAMIGAFLGWQMTLLAVFFGSLIGAVVGTIVKLVTGKDYIPFGPFLSVGALITVFFGQQLLFWYWNLTFPPL